MDDDLPRSLDEWEEVIDEARSAYFEFADRLENLVIALLDDEDGVYYERTSHSVARTGWILDRMVALWRDGGGLSDPRLTQPDLATVVVVAEVLDHLPGICELLQRELVVDLDTSLDVDAASALNDDPQGRARIAYHSPRFVVTLPESRAQLPEWSPFSGFRAQIEVRTVLQDTWNTLFDSRAYTSDTYYPDTSIRALADAAMLFRAADEAVTAVDQAWREAREVASRAVEVDALEAPIDAASLTSYVLDSGAVATVVGVAEEAGMQHDEHRDTVGGLEDLVWVLRACGIETLQALDDLLHAAEPRLPELLARLNAAATERGEGLIAAGEDLISFLAMLLTRADAAVVARSRWSDPLEDALNSMIGNPTGDTEA